MLPLVFYLGAGLLFEPPHPDLQVERTLSPDRVSQDTLVTVLVEITNHGAELEDVLLEDILPPRLKVIEGETRRLCKLKQGETTTIEYHVQGQRGLYVFRHFDITAQDRLGVFRQKLRLPARGQIAVLPSVLKLRRIAIRPRLTRIYSGNIPARQGGPGVEFFGVREYQAGDSLRWINWKSSARHPGSLFSNEFEQERIADVGLVLDARERASEIQGIDGSLFEHQVIATASLAESLLVAGHRVGLLIYGGFLSWTYPGYGKLQRERIFQALAAARTGSGMIFDKLDYLPTRMLPYRSQLILVSTLLNEDLPFLIRLRARNYQVMVISPDPIAFQECKLPASPSSQLAMRLTQLERQLLFRRLRQAGIQVINWNASTPFDQAMLPVLSRLPAWTRLLGMTP
jgi:uncharacterized protein (DUF58 family)